MDSMDFHGNESCVVGDFRIMSRRVADLDMAEDTIE